jgi:LysM repeat protein
VIIPQPNPNSVETTPTPDFPHALPTQRDFLDQYTVQPGDTLGSIANAYGITLEALLRANGLNETSLLTVGMVLEIPPIEADSNLGSSFKLIPDSELVYGPASAQFDIGAFIQEQGGYLASYTQDVNGEYGVCCPKLFR